MEVAADLASSATLCSSGDQSPFKSRASALPHVALKACSGCGSSRCQSDQELGLCLESQEVGSPGTLSPGNAKSHSKSQHLVGSTLGGQGIATPFPQSLPFPEVGGGWTQSRNPALTSFTQLQSRPVAPCQLHGGGVRGRHYWGEEIRTSSRSLL